MHTRGHAAMHTHTNIKHYDLKNINNQTKTKRPPSFFIKLEDGLEKDTEATRVFPLDYGAVAAARQARAKAEREVRNYEFNHDCRKPPLFIVYFYPFFFGWYLVFSAVPLMSHSDES